MAASKRATDWPPAPEPLPSPVVDNHSHLDMVETWQAPGWVSERPEYQPTLFDHLERAASLGVDRVVQVGCDVDSIRWTDEFLHAQATLGGVGLLGAVAIHPNEAVLHAGIRDVAADGLDPAVVPRHDIPLAGAIAEVERIARTNPRIRAIGETGLDYFRSPPAGHDVQRQAFRDHIALAKELDLALQIHDRDAHADVVDILHADGAPARTVFHCFSGDAGLARLCADNGWYVSVAGTLTFRSNHSGRAAVSVVPPELILLETDAPFLTPHPHRGQGNSPYLAAITAREIAAVHGRSLESVCRTISAVSESIYGSWSPSP